MRAQRPVRHVGLRSQALKSGLVQPRLVFPRLCCKTRKYRFSKILAKVASSPILARESLSGTNRKVADESIQIYVVPCVPQLRTLQPPLESWLCPCRRVLQHTPPTSGHRLSALQCPLRADFVAEVADDDGGAVARTRLLMRWSAICCTADNCLRCPWTTQDPGKSTPVQPAVVAPKAWRAA